ncbi:MAG TPA: hypothetical protein VG735_03870 [Caulobacterales bacterium]|nr:hypothetical protein [Caulobacterales bacterium]
MKKLIAGALAAVTMAAVTIPTADARPYRDGGRYYSYGHRYNGHGDAVAAGIAGLAIGAIIGSASSQPRYYDTPRGYYAPPPRAYYEPRYCSTRDWAWDPYLRRNVLVERSYPC